MVMVMRAQEEGFGIQPGHTRTRAPQLAGLRQLGPLLELRRKARARERLVQRVAVRELRTPVRTWMTDPWSQGL